MISKTLLRSIVLGMIAGTLTISVRAQGRPPGGWFENRFAHAWERSDRVDQNENPPCSRWTDSRRYVFTTAPGNLDLEIMFSPFGNRANDDVCYDISLTDITNNHQHGTLRPTISKKVPRGKEQRESRQTYTETRRYSLPKGARILMVVQVSGRFDYRIRLRGPKEPPQPPAPEDAPKAAILREY